MRPLKPKKKGKITWASGITQLLTTIQSRLALG